MYSLRVMEDTLSGPLASSVQRTFHAWHVCLDWKRKVLLSVCIVELKQNVETFTTEVQLMDL